MILAGIPLSTLLAIFGAAGGAVLVLYILKLRRRVVAVPFAPLWKKILKDKEATSLFSKLKRLLSLLLQLALLALLVLALGNPRFADSMLKGRAIVVLIDASASMQATDVAPNRLASAKDQVKKMIRGLGGADQMLIAQMDAVVTPLGPMSDDTSELERMLDQIKPTETRADFARALRYAFDSLGDVAEGSDHEIVVVSDGRLGEAKDASGPVHPPAWCQDPDDATKWRCISYVSVGQAERNVAITQFSVRRYPLDKSRYEVMFEVTNTGPSVEDVELGLYGDGQLVDLTNLRLKPGERLPRFYPNLSGASRTIEAKIAPIDASEDNDPADNHAYALLPERRRAKVLVVTEGNTYLEAALLLDEYLDVTDAKATEYPAKVASNKYDVVIFDGITPAEMPNTNALYLDPRGPGSPVKSGDVLAANPKKNISGPGFDKLDRKHPIIRWTALDDVNISMAHKLTPEQGDKVVGASDQGASPILIAGVRKGNKFVAIGFDIRDSDFPLRIAWPLFLLDSINWFMDEDSKYLSSFRTGDVWRVPMPGSSDEAILKTPDGLSLTVPIHEGRAVFLGERAGFYQLKTQGASGEAPPPAPSADPTEAPPAEIAPTEFAANLLDYEESTIGPAKTLPIDGREAGALGKFEEGVRREIWIYLLIVAAIVTALEWATYHRRLTV